MYRIAKIDSREDKLNYEIYETPSREKIAQYMTKENGELICRLLNKHRFEMLRPTVKKQMPHLFGNLEQMSFSQSVDENVNLKEKEYLNLLRDQCAMESMKIYLVDAVKNKSGYRYADMLNIGLMAYEMADTMIENR